MASNRCGWPRSQADSGFRKGSVLRDASGAAGARTARGGDRGDGCRDRVPRTHARTHAYLRELPPRI